MDVRLSPEQRTLRDSAALLVDRLGPATVRSLDDYERVEKLDAAVAATGWRELRCPSDDGTPWASAVEVAIVAEELGRRCADTAFVGPTLAAELRRLAGAPATTDVETVLLAADLGAPGRAVALDAHTPSTALVLLDDGAIATVAAPRGQPRVDLTRPVAVVEPAAVPVPVDAAPLTSEDRTKWTALGLAVACADLTGTMGGAVDLAVAYAKERRQFGRPVGSFQAVQHLLADAFVATEGSRSVALHAAWAVDALPAGEALAAASGAKAYCGRAARTVCEAAIQVHGGIGNTWDCFAHVYLRRALLSTDLLGGVGPSLDRVLAHHGVRRVDGLR